MAPNQTGLFSDPRATSGSGLIPGARPVDSISLPNRCRVVWFPRLGKADPAYRNDLKRHHPRLKKIAAKINSMPQQRATWSISGYCLVSNWS